MDTDVIKILYGEDNQHTIDHRHQLFEWSPGYEIDDYEQLIMEVNHENISYYKETNVDEDDAP